MKHEISHSFDEETLEAKARWFMQKPIEQRLREALEGIALAKQWIQFESPDDRKTFTTVRVLEQAKS